MPQATLEPILPQGMLPLAPMTGDGPPRHRIDDPGKAQTIVVNLWQASQERNLKNAAIQGQIDGNPPYNPEKMRRAGRAGDANFNTLEAKALRSTAMVPYYDLFAGGNRYVEIKLDLGDDVQASYASGIVSEEYDRLLRRYRGFEFTMYGMMIDYVTFGKGFLTWQKNGSWRMQRIAHYRVLTPDATPVELDEVELLVVLQNWPVTYLQDAIRDTAAAKAAGWDIEETRNAIMSAVPADPSVPNDPMAVQAQLRDSDIYVAARNSTVQAATVFVKEFDGRWSELIVRRDQIPTMSSQTSAATRLPGEQPPRFMFKRYSHYKSVHECLCPFFFEPADTNWNGASGLGRDIFPAMQLKDRISCTQADAVFLRNSIILAPKQETDRTKLNLMQLGRVTVLPPGLDAQDSSILGDITSTIEVSRELSLMLERNTGIYRPTLEKGGGNPDTLGEFQTKFAQATVLSSSAITRFYSQLDRLYEEQWKRVIAAGTTGTFDLENAYKDDDASDWRKEARRFVARCEARGVSKDMLKRCEYIRAFRAIGQGSAAMRQQVVSTFLNPQVFPLFPPDGQQNILEDFTRTLGGQTAVNRYLPMSARLDLPTNDQWQAMQENAAMKIGAPVTWTPNQNNLVHAQFHLVASSQAAQSLQAGANPMDVLAYLDMLGAHIAEHLQRESANPMSKPAVKALEAQWKRLAQFADGLRQQLQQNADQQQQLAEKQQKVLTDTDIKMMETQAKLQQSQHKMQETLRLKEERQAAELALKAQQLQGTNAMSDATTAADITRQTAKTAADIENQRLKAEAAAQAAKEKAAQKPSSSDR
jgi:hypothetical protein